MKNLITYLKALWSRVADSQSSDVGYDSRLTVGSPSGFNSKLMLKLVSVLVLILTLGVGNVWGATYTYDFTKGSSTNYWTSNNVSGSVGTSNIGTFYYMQAGYSGHCFTAGNGSTGTHNHKFVTTSNSQCFFLGKTGEYLTLPTYSGQLITSVTVYMRSGQGSTSAKINIFSGSDEASTEQTASTSGATFAIDEEYQADALTLKLTSNHNTSIQTLVVTTAVDGCEWSETFSLCAGTGGNDGLWSGSIATATMAADNTGWTFSQQKAASQCGKFGTTSAGGSAQTPTLTGLLGTLTVKFKAGAWNAGSEGTTLNLATTQGTLSESSVTLAKGKWSDYTVTISGVTTATKITFSTDGGNKRFFLDDICVSTGPSCSAPATPTISGTAAYNIGQTITLTASHDGSNHDASTTYTWYKGADWATASGTTPVQAAATGSDGYTFTKTAVAGDAGTYWCEASNGSTCKAHNSTGKAITVSCAAPSSVTITGTTKYLGGQTISLTATPTGGAGDATYQWQKKVGDDWTNLTNGTVAGVTTSGATSDNLQISSCTHTNSGGYRCIVTKGGSCSTSSHADNTNGYGVHVFSIHGKYSDGDYEDHEITWTSGTTGTKTLHLNAKKTYLFKVWSNNGYYYGHGTNANEDFMFQPTTWDCGVDNREMRLFTTIEGDYTFTVNIEHGLDGTPYVNVQVGYPSVTHPSTGYVYVQKFSWRPYLHYWYNNDNVLSTWGNDPQLNADQYIEICGTEYWCVPVIDYYCNFIAKDAAGAPSNTTGDQHTNSPHPGQKLYNDDSWNWAAFPTYTISFDRGTGTGGSMSDITGIGCGTNQVLTDNAFTKTGYNFDGWKADVDVKISGSTVSAGTKFNGGVTLQDIRSDIALTAQWVAKSCSVTFDKNGGTGGSDGTTATYGSAMTTITPPTRAGYTFDGYWDAETDNNGSGNKYYNANGTSAANWNKDTESATTLYAKWVAKTDTYKTGLHTGASGWTSYASGVTKNGAGYTIPNPGSVAKGGGSGCEDTHYYFAGWVADEYKASPDGHIISASGTTDATGTTYWAVWGDAVATDTYTRLTSIGDIDESAEYVLGIDGTGFHYSGTSSWGLTALPANQTPLYYTLTKEDAVTPTYFTAETSVSSTTYYLQVAGTGAFNMTTSSGTTAGQLVIGSTTNYGGSDKAYAVSVNGSTDKSLRRNGASGIRCYNNTTTGSLVFFYKVVPSGDIDYVTSCCELKPATSVTVASTTGTSVTLSWTAPSPTTGISKLQVRNASDDAVLVDNLLVSATGATVTGLTECDEYTFYVASVGATCYTASESVDAQPYSGAKTITYKYHDGATDDGTFTTDCSHTSTTLPNPSRTGYTLKGWYTAADGGTKKGDGGASYAPDATITLHAQWTEKPKYTITLNAGNGTISDANWTNTSGSTYTRTQSNGDEAITLPTPSCGCAGWVFKGWSTTSKDNAGSFTPDKEDGASFTPASNVTYYAVYRQSTPSGTTYTKITDEAALTTGDYLIVAYSSYYYAMGNSTTSGHMTETSSSNATSWSNPSATLVWTIIKVGDKVGFYNASAGDNAGKYLTIVDGAWVLADDGQLFTYSFNNTTKAWTFTSPSGKQMRYASYYYVGDEQSSPIYLYKRGDAESGNYYTNPSCSDYSVTGVANPAAGGTVQLTAAAAKSGDKVWACYTADPEYDFTSWSISGTGVSPTSATTQFVAITVGTSDVTVTANFAAKVMYNVTWKANNVALTGDDLGSASVRVEDGHKVTTLPPTPSSCDDASTTFMGWVADGDVWSGKTDDVSDVTIYTKASDLPTVTGDVTYHAVWAKRNGSAAPATYAGTGVFTKITTMEELEVGAHYVLYGEKADDNTINGAMNNTFSQPSSGKYIFGRSAVTISDNKITNPATTVVWKLGGEKDAYTLYSQNSSKYVEITIGDARGYSNPSSPTTSFTIDVNEGVFRIMSNHASAGGRMICLYNGTEFRSYANNNTDYVLYLYKYGNNYTYDNYLVKCCTDPELAFDGEYNYQTLVRQDIHGAHGGNGSATVEQGKATLVLDYATESDGTCTVEVKKLTGGDNRSTAAAGSDCSNHTGIAINESTKKVTFDVWTYAGSYPTANGQGTYRIKITQDATSTYCAAETYYFVDVTLRDKFVDAVNGNATINVDGQSKTTSDYSKTPTEASLDGDKNDDCHSTTRRFLGWVREDNMDTWYGSSSDRTRDLDDKKDDAALVAPNADIITSGSTWYAIWGIEE